MEALGARAEDPLTLEQAGPTLDAIREQLVQRLG
jgi:hypothetical protein